ncbi:MAG: hypothetical protein RJQ09_10205 [Cyclobacteriaceae bacterium]
MIKSYILSTLMCLVVYQSYSQSTICADFGQLVNENIPYAFEGFNSDLWGVKEMGDTINHQRYNIKFAGADYLYYLETEFNKYIKIYPFKSNSKDEVIDFYAKLKNQLDKCDHTYNSFANSPNGNLGIIYSHTIGIDRRFYNSTMNLYEHTVDDESNYWIEFIIVAPLEEELDK